MRLNRFLLGLGLISCVASPAFAFDATQSDYIQPQFLPPQMLAAPPIEGSAAWKRQIDGVLAAQRVISAGDAAAMRDEQRVRLELLTPIMGAEFTRSNLPKVFALLDRVLANTGHIVNADKKFWHTRRPYVADKRVKLGVDPIDDSPAFPSGHTTEARVVAEVLAMLMPEKRDALRARAEAIAAHRVEAGVHYPNDVEGGRMLAMLMVGALTENEDFQDDLAAAQREMAAR